MKQISLLILLFVLSISLNAYMSEYIEKNYEKAKRTFSEEDFNLLNKRLDNYGFEDEYAKSRFLSDRAPEIRGCLRKIGIKEKSVLLDALDVTGGLIKNKFIKSVFGDFMLFGIKGLIDGLPDSIFDYLIQLDSDKIDYTEKYGEKARKKFEKAYSKDKVNTVKQILKQILADLPKD
ncbi:exported protein A EppA [Borreliella bavariensis]|uniref:exported protein A EppA n=1 Tax=Borreliella bavariensis TaxID=664662 RepID=UPI00165DC668|nr:exported protein A EppA [Borreliella bavariensis]